MFNKHFENKIMSEEINTFPVRCFNVFERCPFSGKWMFLRMSSVVSFVEDNFPKFSNLYFCDPVELAQWMMVNYPIKPKKKPKRPIRRISY